MQRWKEKKLYKETFIEQNLKIEFKSAAVNYSTSVEFLRSLSTNLFIFFFLFSSVFFLVRDFSSFSFMKRSMLHYPWFSIITVNTKIQ